MYAVSPLRYPGAKWRLETFVNSILENNNLSLCNYAEPFAGGASLAISLLFRGFVGEIHLNDFDRSIFAFWNCVLNYTDELLDLIETTPVTMESWYAQKDIQANKAFVSDIELGFSTFFLNRANRSGILTAGVIGGKAQAGKWKIDARFNKDNLKNRILSISKLKGRIHLYNQDALDFIKACDSILPERSFVYLDPPYYVKGPELYLNAYTHEDHLTLARAVLSELSLPWMVSYDDVAEIKSLYSKVKSNEESYLLPYSASLERKGREIFFFSPKLNVCNEDLHVSIRSERARKRNPSLLARGC
ncbi:DNA adenine methylase [Pseudomonas poae]|uniref:DNA adenine methylase n=1 Tax=Pseudomonas poae TaxID=200451 RepID=UPI0030CB498F